jgi:hypothetical protein
VLDGEGLLYVLNGLGPEGALPGKPSEARGSLLRREALELALYTFRYLEDVTMVAVLMPAPQQPKPKKNGDAAQAATETPPRQAVFFRPGDVLPQLQAPLNRTLPSKPPRPNALTPQEATRIDSLTLRNVFLSEWQRAQNGVPFLVLQEPESIE